MSQQPNIEQPEPADVPEGADDVVNDPDDAHGTDVTDDAGAVEPTD